MTSPARTPRSIADRNEAFKARYRRSVSLRCKASTCSGCENPGLPEQLVGEQVAHVDWSSSRALTVIVPLVNRRRNSGRRDQLGVRSERLDIRVQPHSSEFVEEYETAAVGELERESVPLLFLCALTPAQRIATLGAATHLDAPTHPEMDPAPRVDDRPTRTSRTTSAPPGRGQLLTGRARPAVGRGSGAVADGSGPGVIDGDDPPANGPGGDQGAGG